MAISDEERKKRLQRAQSIQANALNGKASGDERKQRLKEATEIQNKVLQEYNANKQQQEQEQQNRLTTISDIAHKAAEMGRKTADLSIDRNNRNETLQSLARKAAENQAFRNYNKDGFTMRESTGILNREDEKRIGKDTVAKVQNSPAMRFASQKVAEQTAKRDLEKLGVDNKETEKKISEIYRKNADISFDKKAKNSVTKTSEDFEEMLKEADKKMSYNELHDKMYNFIPNSKEEAQAYINTVDQMSNHNIEVSANKKMYVFAVDKALKAGAELSDEQKEKYVKFKDDENLDLLSAGKPKYGTFTSKMDNEYFKNLSFSDKLDKVMRDTGDTATAVGSALVSGAAGLFTELVGYVGDGFDKVMEGINWSFDKMSNDLLGIDTDIFKKNKEFWGNVGSGEEWHKATEDMHSQAVENNMNLGMSQEAAEMLTSLEEAVGQAIPQVAMAVATGGSSEALYAAKSMANAERAMNITNAAAKGSKLAMAGQSLKTIATDVATQYKAWAKQPMFTTTLITEMGSNYDDAVEQGADPKTALAWAAFVSLVNSGIEMGGGIEAGPSSVLKEALEEGAEEIYQGTVSGLMKVATVPDIPLVSIDGSNAAFKLKELALSFVGGALGGATGGGIGKLIDFSANPITTAQKRKALGNAMKSDENTLAAYIDMGMKSGNDKIMSEATSILNALDRGKLDSIASVTLGKFAQKTERAYQLAVINKIANAEKSDDTKANIKTASKIYTAIGQIINNPEYYLSDTLAVDIKHNPVAGEILTKSAGLQSRINEYTPVSTIREVARMVSNNISNGVRDNSNISIDQVGRPVNTNSPRAIDEGAIERVRDKTAKLDDYLSVTGKSLDSYRKDNGSYSADEIIAEANSVITELDRIKSENPVKASEPAAHDSIITENASTGMDVVNPQNVVTVKDDSITLDNGVTVPVTDELLSQNDSRLSDTTKKLYSTSAEYKDKDNVKAAFISSYNGGNVDTYIKQFQNVYDVFELTGKLSEDERYDAVKYIEQALGKEAFNIARKAGQQARHEREQAKMRQNERQKASKENNKGKNKTAQRVPETAKKGTTTVEKDFNIGVNGTLDAVTTSTYTSIIGRIAKQYNKRGINVEIINKDDAPNGWYTQSSNTITVNLSAQNPLEAFLHETGHAIKSYAGEYWEEIKNAAFTYIAQIEDESISDLRRVKAEVFEQQSIPYTKEDIDEEIVSDAIGAMARDKDSVLKFYNALLKNGTKENFAKKIIRKLKEILMKLKAHFLDFDTIAVEYNSSVTRAVREGNTSKTPFFEYADKISNILSQSFENLQVTETKGDTKYSIEYDVNNHPYVIIEEDILKGVARKDVRKKVSTIIRDKFSPGIQVGNNYIKINAKSRNEFVNSKATQAYFERNKQIFADKMNSANNLDEIIWASRDYVEEAPSHKRTDNFDSFGRGQVQISIDNKEYVADIIIGHTTNNEMIFYDVINIRPTNIKKRRASYKVEPKRPTLASGHSASSNNTISQNDTVVNSNISKNSENDTRKFSLKEPIEETKNLIAVHNLNIENLEKSLELGGLPMPSIAITKDKLGHVEFGEVSLVFGKDTINPQINSANKIYSGDAYTPTFPSVEYKLSDSKLKEVADYFNMSQSYLEDKINASNIDYTVETLSDIHEIREQYLRDNNITLSEEEKDAYFSKYLNAIFGKNNFQNFRNYIRDKIKPIFSKRGIYNGADPFTPSGNRKSFEALHYDYTLENLVKAMRRGEQTGEGLVNGISSFSGAVTKQYNSIRELHKNENRIVKMSDYERKKLIKSYQDKLSSIIDSMLGDQNSILYYANAEEVIIESVRNGLSLNSISKILSKYKDVYNITEQTAKDIKTLAEDVQNLPTKYFESKPQRAVYFSEVKKALLPQDASDKIIQDLYDAGVEKVEKYEDDIDRLNKLNSFDDVKFSLKEDTKKEWTPIKPTEKTQKVLDRLANNEYIPLDQIRMLKEINEAYTKRGDFEPTININTPYRQNLRLKIQDDVEKLGSARLDENGKWVYDNPIRKEKRIDVVIGLPAVGKSTVFADPLSNEHGSRIVDCDIIKEKLPEFNQGYGSDNVHQESKIINDKILQKAMYNGENIVLPIIGSEYNKLVKRLEEYKNVGYSVHLHLNEVPQNKALGRMLNRYFEQGRFLNPSLPYEYQNKPTEVFNRIIAERGDLLDGYSHYSNDVRRGEEPIFIKGTERTRKADVSGGNEENRRAISENDRRGRRDVYDVNNATSEQPDDKKDPFRKYSLLEDIDIKLAKKAYERNKKLQIDTQVVKDLFEKAGRVLDKATVDAVADKIAKRYYFGGDSKMKQLLRDKLYAFYTYVSREDAVDAQIALYGYEVSKDIVAMSKEVSGFTDGENVYEEYGESIYDVIYADLINEYANTAIIQAPQRLQEEHEKIAERYRKAEPDSEEKKSLYRELEASRDKLVAARERYVRSREEVKKLDTLLRRTQSYYKRKLDSKKAKSLAYSLRPEQKRIRNKEIMKLVDKYGAYPQNEYSKVDAYVPKRDSRGLAISRVPKTIIESDFADENTINTINDAILDGALSHEIKSNRTAQKYAERAMEKGFDEARVEFKKEIEKIKTFADDTPNKVALAKELIEEAQRRGDQDTVRDIVTDLAIYGLLGGRTTQAFNMLRATGATGQALYLEKWVQRRNKELEKEWDKKWITNVREDIGKPKEFKPLVLNGEIMQRLVNTTDEEEITELSTKIMADLALQENSTLSDKIQAWRYMSMLTNSTTHIRNIVGNGIFAILREGQNTVRAGLEKALNKASGGKIKLTTVVKIKDEYKKFAKEDWKKSNSLARKSGKYNIDDFIMQEKQIFRSKLGKLTLEKARKFNSWALEAEDGIFIKYAYTRALGRYLQAQKISLEENSDPKLEQERQSRIEEARAYALEESLIATYRNANAVATALTQLANKNAAFDILVNSVMPFKKTPANIFVQSMKYSPIGIGLGIKQIVFDGIKHQKTANQIIDTFASGITGTGVFLLGLLLRRLGILQGMFDDDDGDDQIDKMEKIQENSINLFGQSFTIDWSAPAIVPLMMGAEFSDGIGNFQFDGSLTANIWQIVSRSVDPLINMTMLEGLNDMLTSIKYSENNSIGELGFRAISNYTSQFIPTVGGKIARTLDGTSRMTYIDPDDNDFLSRNIQNVQKKSPFWYSGLQPVVDEWGREDKEGNVITRILENFISPGYWETIDSDDATDVIEDLYDELQDKSLLPKKPEKSFTMYVEYFDGEKHKSVKDEENYKNGKRELSGDEYTTAALSQGQTQHDLIAELKGNSVYESMNGAEKAAVIENIYKFAKYAGKYAVDDSYYGSEQEKWCRELNEQRSSLTGILNEILDRSREK